MTVRRFGSLAVVLLLASLVSGQGSPKNDPRAPKEPPKPAPGSLEDTLEKALRNSADIKAAESKVRDAEAELNRVRHQVLTRATAVYSDLNLARRMVGVAEQMLGAAITEQTMGARDRGGKAGTEKTGTILAAQAMVEKHKGEVEKLEAELKALRGEFALRNHAAAVRSVAFDPDGRLIAGEGLDGSVRIWDATDGTLLSGTLVEQYLNAARAGGPKAPAVSASMADRVRNLLDQEVTFKAENVALEDALRELLAEAKSDIPVRVILQSVQGRPNLPPGKLPVGAWIQAIEDTDPNVVVVVRDYGLLFTTKNRVPHGAVAASELWKTKKAEPKAVPKGPGLPPK